MNKIYSIEFNSYWHIGSGLSGGVEVDSLVLKDNDKDGLPYIPGKTLKGLIREGADVLKELSAEMDAEFITKMFGKRTEELLKSEPDTRKPGELFFSNAYLSKSLQNNITKNKTSQLLYQQIASTEINDTTGTSVKNSLREIEVCIPLTLYAEIRDIPEGKIELLEKCLKMVKQMGLNRNRGLGRCKLKFVEEVKNDN